MKPGTNYNYRGRWVADPAAELTAVALQVGRCQQGDHDITEAEPRRVTYVRGSRVAPGTRYCRYCGALSTANCEDRQ